MQKVKLEGRSYVLARPDEFQEFIGRGGHSHVCPEVIGLADKIKLLTV